MEGVRRTLYRLKAPQFTGSNRCMPCTVINGVIAVGLAFVAGWIWWPLGIVVLGLGLATIWLRGYLVPGTPTLTRRYFPPWLLERFGKAPSKLRGVPLSEFGDGDIDTEATMLQAGIAEQCDDIDDLCLDADFRASWSEQMSALRNERIEPEHIATLLDLDPDVITITVYDEGYVLQSANGHIGQWESRAALIADIAAVQTVPEWIDGWSTLAVGARVQILGGLRIFIETCPECDGAIELSQERVESCCGSWEVIAGTCASCGARILEATY